MSRALGWVGSMFCATTGNKKAKHEAFPGEQLSRVLLPVAQGSCPQVSDTWTSRTSSTEKFTFIFAAELF